MQAIRPPFSFSSCRKRKRPPAAKRKRALSVVSLKDPFNRAFCEPQVHTGHRLKAYAPLRTLSRLLWQFVQHGGVTVSDRKFACFVLHCTASNGQRLCQAFGTAGISGRAAGKAQKTFRLRQPFPSLPRCGFLLFVKRRKWQRQLAVKRGTQKRCKRRDERPARPVPRNLLCYLFPEEKPENGGRIACTETKHAGKRQKDRVQKETRSRGHAKDPIQASAFT